MAKVLVIRFSSIGDIVLTTPVLRCLKQQIPQIEIHYLTKKSFNGILESNPHVSRVHAIEKEISNEVIQELKAEKFDYIIDLHNNLRSRRVRMALGVKSYSFNKINIKKWLLVKLKLNRMPDVHIVDRYLKTVEPLGAFNDGLGLDYFIPANDEVDTNQILKIQKPFIAIVIGAKHFTKQLPAKKIIKICEQIKQPIVLLGGKEDEFKANEIIEACKNKNIVSGCGKLNLNQSASVIKQASKVLTNDTGLMHIASSFNKKIISVWGNTVPEFGMYPYLSLKKNTGSSTIIEIKDLSCRPCSKLGYDKCPKGHFKCMNDIDEKSIIELINS